MKDLGARIEQCRKKTKLTRAELSQRLGISEGSLRDLEILNSTPRRLQELLPKISSELRVSLSYLLLGKDSSSSEFVKKEASKIVKAVDAIISSVD